LEVNSRLRTNLPQVKILHERSHSNNLFIIEIRQVNLRVNYLHSTLANLKADKLKASMQVSGRDRLLIDFADTSNIEFGDAVELSDQSGLI
jgi:hypothetical protein